MCIGADGLLHDRWTLIEGKHENMRDPSEPLLIVGDVVQLREAIFLSFPTRRAEFQERRRLYKEVNRLLTVLASQRNCD